MRVVGNDELGIGSNSTINELVVIRIGLYQSKVDIDILKLCGVQSSDSLYHVMGNLWISFLRKNLLVLIQYIGIDTQTDTAN